MQFDSDSHPLIRKLESITILSGEETEALLALPMQVRDVEADAYVVREGERPVASCLVLQGFMCRFKFTETGRRQIFAFHTAGDVPDLQTLHLRTMDHNLGTITACRLAFIPHDNLRDLISRQPRIGDILWRDTLIDAAIFREWMLGIGRRSARTRIAHLLCELVIRLRAVGIGTKDALPLPITQTELGDALGLSTVHVNRTLQELRGDGLFTWDAGTLTVLDWERLQEAGEFDLTYLHLVRSRERQVV